MALILGIESSCDETAAAVVKDGREVLSSFVASQHDTHGPFGGVVPELAARKHVERIDSLMADALAAGGAKASDLDAVAATVGPGLAGALLIGTAAAKGFSLAAAVPFVGVNHLRAHVLANVIDAPDFSLPVVALIVSGGHTMLVRVSGPGMNDVLDAPWGFELLGQTVDDAAGEAFDKVARYLALGYPGGPVIDKLAASGDAESIRFPRAMLDDGLDFSFSGVKTAVVQAHKKAEAAGEPLDDADVAAAFQEAVVDVLVVKAMRAVRDSGVSTLALAGGVAANSRLRARLAAACEEAGIRCFTPSLALCADNAAMIAAAAEPRVRVGDFDPLTTSIDPNLGLG